MKNEFEKRNPTQTEKLNLRSLDSYPFNIRPTDYWKQKSMEGNYDAYADNDEPTTQEYTITNDDVRDVTDDIANTFDIPEDDIQDFEEEEYDGYDSDFEDSDRFLYDEDDYDSGDSDYEGEDY